MKELWNKINNEYQQELTDFINYHTEKTKNMTEKEEKQYIKNNSINQKITAIAQKYKQKYEEEREK